MSEPASGYKYGWYSIYVALFSEPIATRAEKAELPLQLEKAFPIIM
jgi:hypothetical protein